MERFVRCCLWFFCLIAGDVSVTAATPDAQKRSLGAKHYYKLRAVSGVIIVICRTNSPIPMY